MGVLLKNNTSSLLVGSVSAGATSVVVTTGAGASFPSPIAPDYFYGTLVSPTGLYEIVKCTARVNDVTESFGFGKGRMARAKAASAAAGVQEGTNAALSRNLGSDRYKNGGLVSKKGRVAPKGMK